MPAEIVVLETPQTCAGCGKAIPAGEEAREYPGGRFYHRVEPKETETAKPAASRAAAALGTALPLTPSESLQLLALAGRYLRWIIKG